MTAYATLQQFKDYHSLDQHNSSPNMSDDGVIILLLESASRRIDKGTGQIWYSYSATKYFDMPRRATSLLIFDENAVSISSLVNGNGVAFASTDYILYPYSGPPYDSLGLVDNPAAYWLPTTTGNTQKAISAVGAWGQTLTSIPGDIVDACIMIAVQEYHRRYGEASGNNSVVLPSGMVISTDKMSTLISDILKNNRKIGMA